MFITPDSPSEISIPILLSGQNPMLKKIQCLKNHPILAHVSLVFHDISGFYAWISVNPVLECLALFSFIFLLLSIG